MLVQEDILGHQEYREDRCPSDIHLHLNKAVVEADEIHAEVEDDAVDIEADILVGTLLVPSRPSVFRAGC